MDEVANRASVSRDSVSRVEHSQPVTERIAVAIFNALNAAHGGQFARDNYVKSSPPTTDEGVWVMAFNRRIRRALLETFERLEKNHILEPINPDLVDRSLDDVETPLMYEQAVPFRGSDRGLPLESATRRTIHRRFSV
jgi:hypothetical protein